MLRLAVVLSCWCAGHGELVSGTLQLGSLMRARGACRIADAVRFAGMDIA